MKTILLAIFLSVGAHGFAGEGGATIHIFFHKNQLPIKVSLNDTLIAVVNQEDLVLNELPPGRYVFEFDSEDCDDLRVVDINGDEVVYHRLKRAIGAVHPITKEEALKYLGYGHKQIIINAKNLPKGLPLPR